MKMQITRKLNHSFMYFILEELSKFIEDAELEQKDSETFIFPHDNIVISKPIYISADDELLPFEGYDIFPLRGELVFDEDTASLLEGKKIKASYSYSIVNTVNHTGRDIIYPPLIAFENSGDKNYAFELGSSLNDVQAKFFIHIYGESEEQRDDLCDVLKGSLKKTLTIHDYSNGFYLASNGSLRNIEIPKEGYAYFSNVTINKNPLESVDEIERSRALISTVVKYIN